MGEITTHTFSNSHTPTHKLLVLLVIAYMGLGVTYGLVMPCFEASDEWSHLTLVRYFATHHALPPHVLPQRRASTGSDMAWHLEYHDPPLYYAPPLYYSLGGLLVSWADMDDLPYLLVPSPCWEEGWTPEADGDPRNKNIYAHRAEETLAQSGTVQAVYLLRLLSLGLGAVTVLCAYALARLLWPDRPVLALGAATFVAFNPKFISVSAGVTNDSLLNALFGLFFVYALRCMRDGAARGRWAALGGLAGLALLTKQNGLLLLPLGLLAVAWQRGLALPPYGRDWKGAWRKLLGDGSAFLAAALGVGGWWYVRNAILYGDLLGLETHFASQVALTHFGLPEVLMMARSYWAAFGWAPILFEPPVYVAAGLVMLLALAGIVAAIRPGGSLGRGRGGAPSRAPAMTRRGLALLALAFALNVVGLVPWGTATGVPAGRLLFPTLPAVGVLSAWGLSQWGRWPVARWGLGMIVGLAFLLAACVPWCYLRPAYASPRLPDGMPDTAQPVDLTFQGDVHLAGYEPIVQDLEPGDEFHLTLYWHALAAPTRQYQVWVQLGPQDPTRRVAEDGFWLGGTLYPSGLWQAGDTVRQVHRLSIPEWSPAPGLYWVRIGLTDDVGGRVELVDQSSDMVVLGPWRVCAVSTFSSSSPLPTYSVDFSLGSVVRLLGYDLEQQREAGETILQLALYWQAVQVSEVDYAVFVHLVDKGGQLLGQHDGPPRDGEYPTSWWLPGQTVVDRRTIGWDGASGSIVRLRVGMYDPTTLVRLPVYDDAGCRLPEDTVPLIEIMPGGLNVQCVSD
ncbi:MAG: glycosyltransferase family 39 protein [Chloroflexota bacterium]|nr:glycosyltransferase family 39 protein [Chloroflexota bacterium]